MSCQCGCGSPTTLAPYTRRDKGWTKGEPVAYVAGHHRRSSPVDYVVDDNGCWIWQMATNAGGYGTVHRGGKSMNAHRWYYEQARGPVGEGLSVDHLCRVRLCVNPDHMEAVTQAENCRRGSATKLNADEVRGIRQRFERGEAKKAIARTVGISPSQVAAIVSGEQWADV